MLTARVAIIGGGLSGLYAAALLEARGLHDYVLLEARETFGGRILSLPAASSAGGRFDLGATWFWPGLQPELARVVGELGLTTFEQHEAGDMLIDRARTQPPTRVDGYASMSPALRIVGGMGALIDALKQRLSPEKLLSGACVRRVIAHGGHVEVAVDGLRGDARSYRVDRVLLATPPRLAVSTIEFTPTLPDALALQWRRSPTWMAPHAKYVAVFDRPFWREQGLSGEARSAVGPLAEIHDASSPGGHAALFGFLGIPAAVRSRVHEAELLAHCRAQLERLFADAAALPRAEFLKDWANDPRTAVAADLTADAHHAVRLSSTAPSGAWQNRLIGIASEWSPDFSGYVAGAVDAARRGVEASMAA